MTELTAHTPADPLLEQLLLVEGPEELGAVGRLAAQRFRLAAFEVALEGPDSHIVLARVGDTLPALKGGDQGAVAESDGVWTFAFGAEGGGGLLRIKLRGAPDGDTVSALEQFARRMKPVVLRLVDRERVRQFEQRLELLQDQVRRADRLKEEFLSNLSHELRTPLTAILGFAEILGARAEAAPGMTECAQRIHQNGERLLALLNRLLQLAKLEADRLPVNLVHMRPAEHVRACIARVAPAGEAKGLRIDVALGACPDILLDARHFDEALSCVLENAVKFTDTGYVRVAARAENADLVIEVEDTGRGIDASQLPFIFDAFWQGDGSLTRAVGGNGIGLTLAHRLVARIGGELAVESAVGRGTRVRLRFPFDPAGRRAKPQHRPHVDVHQFGLPF